MGLDLGILILNKFKKNNKTKNSASSRMLLFIICGFVESRILSKSTFQGEICFKKNLCEKIKPSLYPKGAVKQENVSETRIMGLEIF